MCASADAAQLNSIARVYPASPIDVRRAGSCSSDWSATLMLAASGSV